MVNNNCNANWKNGSWMETDLHHFPPHTGLPACTQIRESRRIEGSHHGLKLNKNSPSHCSNPRFKSQSTGSPVRGTSLSTEATRDQLQCWCWGTWVCVCVDQKKKKSKVQRVQILKVTCIFWRFSKSKSAWTLNSHSSFFFLGRNNSFIVSECEGVKLM